jgi:hypothetical protein
MAAENLSVIIFTHFINKKILCQRNNDAERISNEVLALYFTELRKWKTQTKFQSGISSNIYMCVCVCVCVLRCCYEGIQVMS